MVPPLAPHTMATTEQKAQILNRLFVHKDSSPFILITDSLAQSGIPILEEFLRKVPAQIKVVRWKGVSAPPAISHQEQNLVIIENLCLIPDVGRVLQQLMGPKTSLIGIYHRDLEPDPGYAPKGMALVEYMATTVIHVQCPEETRLTLVENPMLKFTKFKSNQIPVELIHRRRSGNATINKYTVDIENHVANIQVAIQRDEEDPSMFAGLTTFNLNTTEKQKADRENVELPYLAAQEIGDGGASGGAIIYQFEKDDDYDEEDPFEDPM